VLLAPGGRGGGPTPSACVRPGLAVPARVPPSQVAVVGERPDLPAAGDPLCPVALRELIQHCWAQLPEDRPSSAVVLQQLQALLDEADAAGGGAAGEAGGGPPAATQ
jgi:hypothetical protein